MNEERSVKDQKNSKVVYILLGMLIVIIVCLVGFIISDKMLDDTSDNNSVVNNEVINNVVDNQNSSSNNETINLDLENSLVQKLYKITNGMALKCNNYRYYYGYFKTGKTKILANDLSDSDKVDAAFSIGAQDFTGSDGEKYVRVDVGQNVLEQVFGKNITFNKEKVTKNDCGSYNYDKKQDAYKYQGNCGCTIMVESYTNKLVKAVKEGNNINLYVAVGYVEVTEFDPLTYTLYYDNNMTSVVAQNLSSGYNLSNYQSKLQEYKFTFVKNDTTDTDGNYYFYSIEKTR